MSGLLVPGEAGTTTIIGDAALQEVLLADVDRLAHPWERIPGAALMVLPIYIILGKSFVRGIMAGSVKG